MTKQPIPHPVEIECWTKDGKLKPVALYPVVDVDGNVAYENRQGRILPKAEYERWVMKILIFTLFGMTAISQAAIDRSCTDRYSSRYCIDCHLEVPLSAREAKELIGLLEALPDKKDEHFTLLNNLKHRLEELLAQDSK